MTWSVLHEACKHNETGKVVNLANNGDDAFQTDDHGSTPLHLLCLTLPDPVALKALIEANPVAVSDRDFHGDTPIHLLCRQPNANRKLMEMLVEADPHCLSVSNKHGYLPLHVACKCAPMNLDVISFLVKSNPYALACHVKVGELVKRKQHRPIVSGHMIDRDAGLKTTDSVDIRLMQFEDFERDGGYPLHMAISSGAPVEVVALLTNFDREVLELRNKHGYTPLVVALMNKADEDVTRVLLGPYMEALHVTDKKGNLPIHVAAMIGTTETVMGVLVSGCSVSTSKVNRDGLTALELAMQHGNCSAGVMELLSRA